MNMPFETGCSDNSKIANKSKDLVKVLLKSNQKSTDLSVNRWCRQTVIADDRKWFANFYGTYKDNMFHDHTLGNNKTPFHCWIA